MANKIKAVLFDLDGMLVDSQMAALSATAESLAQFGVQVPIDNIRKQFGGGSASLLKHFMSKCLGPDKTCASLTKAIQIKNNLQVKYTTQVRLLPNISRLLIALKSHGYLIGLATMSSNSVAQAVLSHHELDHYFDAIITADDVTHPKPNPEILLLMLKQIEVKSNEVIFAGDSTHDLEAARRAKISFILADTGIYVRGKTRITLRNTALQENIPIVTLHNLFDIFDIVRTFQQTTEHDSALH